MSCSELQWEYHGRCNMTDSDPSLGLASATQTTKEFVIYTVKM